MNPLTEFSPLVGGLVVGYLTAWICFKVEVNLWAKAASRNHRLRSLFTRFTMHIRFNQVLKEDQGNDCHRQS